MKKVILLFIFLSFYNCKTKNQESVKENETASLVHVSSDKGKQWNVFGVKIVGKILSEDTDGKYSVIETETPPIGGPPKHVHKNEDELFYVIKGTYEFYCGDKTIIAKKGDMVRLPRGIPHHFKNIDSVPGVTMNVITPGGFESFFDDVAQASKTKKLSRSQIDSIAATYGMTFVKK